MSNYVYVALAFFICLIVVASSLETGTMVPRRRRSPPPSPSLPPPPPPVPPFDYFTLAETWPPTFCMMKKCVNTPPRIFSIHGLWPSNKPPRNDPRECYPKLQVGWSNIITQLQSRLETYWPDLTKPKSNWKQYFGFWNEQWRIHGTCSSMDSYNYFDVAVEIHKKIDLTSILQKKNFPRGKAINKVDIVKAIFDDIHHKPQLVCQEIQNQWHVSEIRLCLDKNNVLQKSKDLKYIDCPFSSCPDQVYLP